MANIPKIGLEYYPTDVNMFSDIKIRKLIKYRTSSSIAIYNVLLCQIYQNGYFLRWDEDSAFIITELLGNNEEYIVNVLECCLDIGIFSRTMFEKHRIITSAGIQKRYEKICKDAKRKNQVSEYSLINTDFITINTVDMPIPSEYIPINDGKKTQRTVQNSTEQKSIKREDEILENLTLSNCAVNGTLVGDMISAYKKRNPMTFIQVETETSSALKIAQMISEHKNIPQHEFLKNQKNIIEHWNVILDFIQSHSHFGQLSISALQKQWTGVMQAMAVSKTKQVVPKQKLIV